MYAFNSFKVSGVTRFFVVRVARCVRLRRMRASISLIILCKHIPAGASQELTAFARVEAAVCKLIGDSVYAFDREKGYAAMDRLSQLLKKDYQEFLRFDIDEDRALYGSLKPETVKALQSFSPKSEVYSIYEPPPAR